jgi:SPP1 family predicted phage head-tail adaptor
MVQSSGFRNKRVHIINRDADAQGEFGRNSGGRAYKYATTVWASVRFSKGVKSLREGALDAYDTLVIGMLYTSKIDRESAIVYDGRTFQIKSFNRDYQTNEIQLTVVEWPGKDFSTFIPQPSSSDIGDTTQPDGTAIQKE